MWGETMKFNKLSVITTSVMVATIIASTQAFALITQNPEQIVEMCENQNHGNDHISMFSITVQNRFGQKRQSVYQRFWKSFRKGGIQEKMSLFTLAPSDAKNTAFMKVSYKKLKNKEPEQWLYLPATRSLRTISRRDKNESFLGSDLTYDDIEFRSVGQDRHKILNTQTIGRDINYIVESTPKERDSMYSRKVVEYHYSHANKVCLKKNIHYYDRNNHLLKTQDFTWQNINDVWLWDKVIVKNSMTLSTSLFKISKPKVNTGLSDKWFSKRLLKRGI